MAISLWLDFREYSSNGATHLTEKEVHDIWIKKRYEAFAEVIGVELSISDISAEGKVTIKALRPILTSK